jgi:putative spermidine/putrescine transport system permease protein
MSAVSSAPDTATPDISSSAQSSQPTPQGIARRLRLNLDWVGLLPFFAFVTIFMIAPGMSIIIRALTDGAGNLTTANLASLGEPVIQQAYRFSIQVSIITALSGGLIGGLLSWAVALGGLPGFMRSAILSFCGVAANFAGIPLVFAFIAMLGRVGLLNTLFRSLDWDITIDPQSYLYSFFGLCLVYTYFQIPLMVLITVPALEGLRKEWREAAENLGATNAQYWRYVAIPILMPSILGSLALLFANAFSTYATAVALLGAMGQTFAVTIVVANQFRTDTFGDPGLGYALAFTMIVVVAITVMVYTYSRRRAERWLQRT